MILSSPCWRKAFGIKVKSDSNSSNQIMLSQEATFITQQLLKTELSKENIIEGAIQKKIVSEILARRKI